MKHLTLTITEMDDDDLDPDLDTEIVKVRLAPGTDPTNATLTVLQALQSIPKPRAPRSDLGTKRTPQPAAAQS